MAEQYYNLGGHDDLRNNTNTNHIDENFTNRNSSTTGDGYVSSLFNARSEEYENFIYTVFTFERAIYLYIWEVLVTTTFLVNIFVIWILLQKKMRSLTNLILVAIAISDSLTGLVTLPSFIMVYTTTNQETGNAAIFNFTIEDFTFDNYTYDDYPYDDNYGGELSGAQNNSTRNFAQDQAGERDVIHLLLSKSLCQGFMISKYFLARSFHTVSIWLTVFLGIQRFFCVAYPFKTQTWFTFRNTLFMCVTITTLAPILHLYHLLNEKASRGFCSWTLKQGHIGDAAHLWASLLLRHLIPCGLLSVTTILFVHHLNNSLIKKRNSSSTHVFSGNEVRTGENRRVSKIVIAIMIVFLIPEIPYALFHLFSTIVRHTNANHLSDLKRNRAFHAGYDIALVLSYQMNFYIYTFFNRKFRRHLIKMCTSFGGIVHNRILLSTSGGRQTIDGVTRNQSLSNTSDKKEIEMKFLSNTSKGPNEDE